MASTHFTTGTTITSEWLNDVNDAVYEGNITAEGVQYTPPFTDSVTTNVQNKLSEIITTSDFDGVTKTVLNTTNQSVAVGEEALFNSVNSPYSVVIGNQAAHETTDSGYITAIGFQAGYASTGESAGFWTAVGYKAGASYVGQFEQYGSVFVGNSSGTNNNDVSLNSIDNTLVGSATGQQMVYLGNGPYGPDGPPPDDLTYGGGRNTAFGAGALQLTSNGSYNTAIGLESMQKNTHGKNNTAVGYQTLWNGNDIVLSVALGTQAGWRGTANRENTFVGYNAGYWDMGSYNTALGAYALSTAGGSGQFDSSFNNANNIAIGAYSLASNKTGDNNVGIGFEAMYSLTDNSDNNTAVGHQAGKNGNTTDGNNTFVGYRAGYNVDNGYNTALGRLALAGTAGAQNTALGQRALEVTTGAENTAIGARSGSGITTGNQNVILGSYDGSAAPISASGSNYVVLSDGAGNVKAHVASTGSWFQSSNSASWATTSDERLKKNITSLENSLDVILKLRAVEFDYIQDNKHDLGFIAQEYAETLPDQVSDRGDGYLAIQQNLVPHLVKAIQQQQAMIEQLVAKIDILENK